MEISRTKDLVKKETWAGGGSGGSQSEQGEVDTDWPYSVPVLMLCQARIYGWRQERQHQRLIPIGE